MWSYNKLLDICTQNARISTTSQTWKCEQHMLINHQRKLRDFAEFIFVTVRVSFWWKSCKLCIHRGREDWDSWSSCSDVADDSIFLVYDAVLMGKWFSMFRVMLFRLLYPEDDGSMILRNVVNYWPNDRTSFPSRIAFHVVVIL